MYNVSLRLGFVAVALIAYPNSGWAASLVDLSIETSLVPSPVNVTVLLPDRYESSKKIYPLFFWLHGGGGDNRFLKRNAPIFEAMWEGGGAPEMVVVTPAAGRSFYLDYRDGSQKWERFITEELLLYIRGNYRVSGERSQTFIGGISMGGMGSLRMAFKRLDLFGAVVSMEPGIEPAYAWKDVKLEDKFWRAPALLEERFGKPFDEAYWAANNPATIVRDNAEAVKASGIAIYIEVGSEDAFGLDRGTDFLHRTLYENGIRHEYRYVYGADHVGNSMNARIRDGLAFLKRITTPPLPDPQLDAVRKRIDNWKRRAGLKE